MESINARNKDVVVQEAGAEILIYDLESNKTYCLNETSALIWRLCRGNASFETIRKNTEAELNKPVSDEFVWLALNELNSNGLLTNAVKLDADFHGFSRRQIIKRVGLASLIALPVVQSIIAPMAVQAQSLSCNSINGTCAPGGLSIACNPNFLNCDSNLLTGCETNRLTSTAHCGTCGNDCLAGCVPAFGVCSSGTCVCI